MTPSVWIIVVCQTLFMSGNIMLVTITPLIGKELWQPQYATLPLSVVMISSLLSTYPLSQVMTQQGKKRAFYIGLGFGIVSSLMFSLALYLSNIWIFLVGAALFGVNAAAANFYRFAAMESVQPSDQSKAINAVLAVGVIAAIVGPKLASYSADWLDHKFLASVMLILPFTLIPMLLLIKFNSPVESSKTQSTLPELPAAKDLYVPVITAMVGFGLMVLIMSATPLHMDHHAYHLDDTTFVIQAHVLGMFVPSFFVAFIIKRIGLLNLLYLGCVLMTASTLINVLGQGKLMLTLGLAMVGVAWNFMFSGSSQLLMRVAAGNSRAQGINELFVFGFAALATLSAGWLLTHIGWQALNYLAMPIPLFVLLLLFATRHKTMEA